MDLGCSCTAIASPDVRQLPDDTKSQKMVRRLRTLSGCLTCRRRRKKCDEARPQCTSCSKLGLRCVWNSSTGSSEGKAHRSHAEVVEIGQHDHQHGLVLRKHQQQLSLHGQDFQPELTAQCSSWIASALSPLALAQWRSAETLMAELQGCRVGREAIAAFTGPSYLTGKEVASR